MTTQRKKHMRKIITLFSVSFFLISCGTSDKTMFIQDEQNDGLWEATEIKQDESYETGIVTENTYEITFWLKPESNFPGSQFLTIGDEAQSIQLLSSTLDNDGIFHGLNLVYKTSEQEEWLVAEKTVSTNRWNYIVLQFEKENARMYLNGEKIGEGHLSHSLKAPRIAFGDVTGKFAALTITTNLAQETAIQEAYQARYAAVLLDTIDYPDGNYLNRSLWFDQYEVDGVPVVWKVEENPIMNYLGVVKEGTQGGEVHAVASITTEKSSAEKEFTFTVLGNDAKTLLEEDIQHLNVHIEGVMHANTQLPSTLNNGSEVTYQILNGSATLEDNRIVKTNNTSSEPITLKATLSLNGNTQSKEYTVVLLDEVYGYAMSYFNGEEDHEVGHIALSTDGLHWEKLNHSFIEAPLGTKRLRDPNIARSKEGDFILTATEGGDHPTIYVATSSDLMTFDNFQQVLVSVPDEGIDLTGTKAWAPEVYYDNEEDLYYIYYADPQEEKGPMFAITTKDFETFSYPKKLFDPGYPVIDGTIFTLNGQYWMLYKDERSSVQTIYPAVSRRLADGFPTTYDWQYLSKYRAIEGPMVFYNYGEERYYVYVDHFAAHTFLAGAFTTLDYNSDINWFDEDAYTLPEEDVRHGSILPITKQEYEKLVSLK